MNVPDMKRIELLEQALAASEGKKLNFLQRHLRKAQEAELTQRRADFWAYMRAVLPNREDR